MKKNLVALVVTFAASAAVQASFGTYDSYGIWFDRDGVDSSQAASWGAVNGGTYNTLGIYNVVINYHAVSPTLATMFATINGIQQGFWDNHYATPAPDIYPAGLSFTGDMNQMRVFDWLISNGGGTKMGAAVFNNITASGNLGTINYGNVTISAGTSPFVNVFNANTWDLTAADLILSYTADLSGLTGPTGNSFIVQIGLRTPVGYGGQVGRGMMGNVMDNSTANNSSLNYNDKFDLQRLGNTDELAYDVMVPEPTTMIAGALLLLPFGASTLRALRKRQVA